MWRLWIGNLAMPGKRAGGDDSARPADGMPLISGAQQAVAHLNRNLVMPGAGRDAQQLLRRAHAEWGGGELWVFGYGSLIWRQEFEVVERRSALLYGWHRALRMRSRVNRGTVQQPGLVFALLPGGACRGVVFKLRPQHADKELHELWQREMPNAVYDPRWLHVRTTKGMVRALAFTLDARSDSCTGRLADEQVLHILRHARGRYGSTLHYLADTAKALREHGVRDREIERLMALAARHGLL